MKEEFLTQSSINAPSDVSEEISVPIRSGSRHIERSVLSTRTTSNGTGKAGT